MFAVFQILPLVSHPLPTETGVSRWLPWWSQSCFLSFSFIFGTGEWQIQEAESLRFGEDLCKAWRGATIWCFWNKSLTIRLIELSGQVPMTGRIQCNMGVHCGVSLARDTCYSPMHYDIVIPLVLKPFSEKQPLFEPEQLQHSRG